jgi:hypothetical protein
MHSVFLAQTIWRIAPAGICIALRRSHRTFPAAIGAEVSVPGVAPIFCGPSCTAASVSAPRRQKAATGKWVPEKASPARHGCSAHSYLAYVPTWLARRGARTVGLDNSAAQLANARRLQDRFGLRFPLIHASAEQAPPRLLHRLGLPPPHHPAISVRRAAPC